MQQAPFELRYYRDASIQFQAHRNFFNQHFLGTVSESVVALLRPAATGAFRPHLPHSVNPHSVNPYFLRTIHLILHLQH